MGVALLDSSVIVGFLDADDPLHPAADSAVRRIATEHTLAVSVVTVAELLAGAKLGHHDEAIVRRFLVRTVSRRIPLDGPVAEDAAELRAAHRALRMPDALILATADRHADVALTGDARWRKVDGLRCRIDIIEPAA